MLVAQNRMIPTSGETTEPSKTAVSNKNSTVSRILAGNTRTTTEATNEPKNRAIFIEAEIFRGQKRKKKHNICDVAEVTSTVFSHGTGVFMKYNCLMGLTDKAAFSSSGEKGNIRNIVRFHDVTATKVHVQDDLLYHVGRFVCRVN